MTECSRSHRAYAILRYLLAFSLSAMGFMGYTPSPARAQATAPFTRVTSISLLAVSEGDADWGDYDGDGDLDLLYNGNGSQGYVTYIYRNDGGTFHELSFHPVGVNYSATAWGDYDNDGDLDIALTGNAGGDDVARLYHNDGGDAFTDTHALLCPVMHGDVAWGDYDNDGDLDLLLTGASSVEAVTILYRNDNGSMVAVSSGLPPVDYSDVAWGDYDNDGDLDLLLTGRNGSTPIARVYRNDGSGVFADADAGLPGVQDGACAWGDIDNDGDLDLALAGKTAAGTLIAQVYRNDGGTFAPAATLPGFDKGDLALGDYDSDGDLDVLLIGHGTSGDLTSVLQNNGTSGAGWAFTDIAAGLPPAHDSAVAWGDYDNDGRLDILLVGYYSPAATARVYHNEALTANSPPDAPAGLSATLDGNTLALSWQAPADPETASAGLTYNLRVGTSPGGMEVVSPMANGDGYRQLPALGNADHGLTATLTLPDLAAGGAYYWSVQAVDPAWAGSVFAQEQTVSPPPPPPEVDITGPPAAALGVAYAFTATVSPETAALPLDYVWQVPAQSPIYHEDSSSYTDSVSLTFAVTGTQTVSATVSNAGGTATGTYTLPVYEPPQAAFSASPESGVAPLEVTFASDATGEHETYSWDFGDGGTSMEANPAYIYEEAGVYTVSLTIDGLAGSDTETKPGYITAFEEVHAAFKASPTSGTVPLVVTFTNQSIGDYDSSLWDFGDTVTSTLESPTHTYTAPGVYSATLTVDGPGGSDAKLSPECIEVYPLAPAAVTISGLAAGVVSAPIAFTATVSPSAATVPLTYTWEATGQQPVTRSGGLGDSVSYTWPAPGTQAVTVTVANAAGSATASHTITLYGPPDAGFAADTFSGPAPLTVRFSNTTEGVYDESLWSFGDGITSTLDSPEHTYTDPGVYTVTLTVSGPGGSDVLSEPNYTTVYAKVKAHFAVTPASGIGPLPVTFENQSTGDYDSCLWDFGDDETSTLCNPPHTYTITGTHAVTLTVSGPGGSDTETQEDCVTVYEAVRAAFGATPTSGTVPLTVTFSNDSTGDYTASQWDLGDGSQSDLDSPTHTYTTTGAYTVTLTVGGPGGTDTATQTGLIHVYPAPPEVVVVTGPLTGAVGIPVTFSAAVTPLTATVPLVYQWQATGQLPVTHTAGLSDTVGFSWAASGTQVVTVTVGNAGGSAQATHAVTVYVPPDADFLASPCSGPAALTVTFTNTTTGDYDTVEWDFGDTVTSTLESPTHTYTTPGVYTVTLTVTGPGGTSSYTRTIRVEAWYRSYLPLVCRE